MNNNNQTFSRLICGVQAYHWGMKGTQQGSLVYELYQKGHKAYKYDDLRNKLRQEDNFAELWMGDHKYLVSQVDGKPLTGLNLPYLFKLLKALSIQVHPNRDQAKLLHMRQPQIYPDENHKPEIAIAIGDFYVLSGFAPKKQIIKNVESNPKVLKYIGEGVWNYFKDHDHPEDTKIFKDIVSEILQWPDEVLFEITNDLHLPQSPCEEVIKELLKVYKLDVGVILLLLMNHLKLSNGQTLLMDSGQIHAYLKGNCVESKLGMANSDNVIRAGFTPKFKDVKTLGEIALIDFNLPQLVEPVIEQHGKNWKIARYITKFEEFVCIQVELGPEVESLQFSVNSRSIMISLKGYIKSEITETNGQSIMLREGECILISKSVQMVIKALSQFSAYICEPK